MEKQMTEKLNLEKEMAALEEIEYKKRTWKSEVFRKLEIWEAIADQINICKPKSEEQKFWGRVMGLYKEKYPNL